MKSDRTSAYDVNAIHSTTLENGLKVLTQRIPGARSVGTGFWVRQGTAHEEPSLMGASHLLEHMVFKGTESRTQHEIALSLEVLGGHLDAYTSREHTSYQARCLDSHLPTAVDVLAELTFRPLIQQSDLETERDVVLEEIATVQDTPDDLVFDMHTEMLWGDHPYGFRILGTDETVGDLTAKDLRAVHSAAYTASNSILVAVGNVDHDQLVDLARHHTADVPTGERRPAITTAHASAPADRREARESAQTHIVTGRTTFAHGDPRRHALVLLSQALGGGMSSRLFQRVREKEGLAYAVYSFQAFHEGGGVEGVYLGTRPESADRAAAVVAEEMQLLASRSLSAVELAQVKEQVKGQVVLSLDSAGSRLYRLAGHALRGEEVRTPEEVLARIDAVTEEQLAQVASEFFDPATCLSLRLGR